MTVEEAVVCGLGAEGQGGRARSQGNPRPIGLMRSELDFIHSRRKRKRVGEAFQEHPRDLNHVRW
jgi:hypothetical protein